jgi:signal transduction histidine kinase
VGPRTGRVRRIATWLALAASLGAGLAFVAVRIATPSDGARVAFYGDAWTSAGILIAPIDQPAAGLRSGDLVQAVDGRPLDAWLGDALDPGAARPAVGAPIPYAIERDGAASTVDVRWAAPAIGATLLDGWSVILFSLATAAIAAFVFWRRPDEPAASALILAACGAAGSSVPWFLGTTVSDVVRGLPFVLHGLLIGPLYMLLWPAGLHLALVFPVPIRAVRRRPAIVPAIYGAVFAAYALLSLGAWLASPSALDWVGSWPTIQVVIVVPMLILTVATIVIRYVRTGEPARKAQMRLATLGVAASGALGLVLFMGPELVIGRPLIPASALGLTALPLPLSLAAGILRDRLFDIEVVLNRTLVYGGLTLAILATYAGAAAGLAAMFGGGQTYGVSLLAAGLAALAALPLRDMLQRAINRLLYGQRDDPWRVMHTLAARLEWAADPGRAFPAIADTLAEALRLPFVAVEVTDEVGRTIVAAEHGHRVAVVESVPLVHGAEPVGRLVLGHRAGEHGFRSDELDLVRDLARQAGAAIHAQRLRDDLARSRERLVVAREEERRRLRRDLHDGLGPALAAIGMRAETSAAVLGDDPTLARHQLDLLSTEIRDALADVRRLVDGLRPPALDELGLVGAIGQQADRLDGGTGREPGGASIRVEAEPAVLPALPAAVEVAAYRIAVEAMTNAVRHAEARSCRVRLAAGSQLTIEVVDDGRGLPQVPRAGTGLESMRERAQELGGDVAIERGSDGGTRVLATLPIGRVAPA